MIYGEALHNDLQLMQEEKRDTYSAAYRKKLSAQLAALSRCANPMVTGRGGFDYHRQENTNRSYQNRYEEFRNCLLYTSGRACLSWFLPLYSH